MCTSCNSWAIAKGTVPIIGVTKIKHIADAKSADTLILTEQEIKQLEDAAKESGVEIMGEMGKIYARIRGILLNSKANPSCEVMHLN
ncbi:hypothetical protein [Bacillus massiliigorillae]|uniref:hypothetical protein n=1 Tax=Bacillus massiliigorillae TaxID=1243664 RepID=UPI0005AA3594|nr:hypothetical protein [Bacillus massiliigorillae]